MGVDIVEAGLIDTPRCAKIRLTRQMRVRMNMEYLGASEIVMNSPYLATLRQVSGRKALSVEFRHPLRPDPSNQGKPGRKVRKGLGMDRAAADRLVEELNRLLADSTLHSPAAKAKATTLFNDPRVIDIFYDGLELKSENYRELRNEHLPFPPKEEGYPRILLVGVPGAGKTTLLRQMIGAHPTRDRFPATSINRTTTCETEVIAGLPAYAAAITFMPEEEVDFEVRQSVSSAILRAVDEESTDAGVARALLERSDMRFRLKYILGDWPSDEEDDDPYASDGSPDDQQANDPVVSERETERLASALKLNVASIRAIATFARKEIEGNRGALTSLSTDERNAAYDAIQDCAEESEAYSEIVSGLLEDLRDKFEKFEGISVGKFVKTTTGWPRLWLIREPAERRDKFLSAVRLFSDNARANWGRLFSPLVNGIRVGGPFSPIWRSGSDSPRFILIDTEGLGHKASTMPDVPDHIVSRFPECDAILLVHKGDVPFSFEGGKALEAIGGAGQTAKTMIIFTRMDEVKGPNIHGWQAKREYSFSGVRNVVEHQIAKSLTPEIARFMSAQLEKSSFYLGSLQKGDPKEARNELLRLLGSLTSLVPPPAPAPAFPDYGSYDLLVLALQKGVEGFRVPWRAYLSLQRHSDHRPLPWQSIKAVSRRYAEGFDDGYDIRPASNLLNTMTLAVGRFLEKPIRWTGTPSPEDKRIILDRIKETVSKNLRPFCLQQLREKARSDWNVAYGFRGSGSTFDRRMKIENLYERWVPEPANEGDDMQHIQEFIDGAKQAVVSAIIETQAALWAKTPVNTENAA